MASLQSLQFYASEEIYINKQFEQMKNIATKHLLLYFISIASLLAGCKTANFQIQVPQKFKEQAEKYPVTGMSRGNQKKPINIQSFTTSKIKRGWNITTGRVDRNTSFSPEERLLRALNVNRLNMTTTQKDRFSFSISNGQQQAQVAAMEQEITEGVHVTSNRQWLNEWFIGKSFQYSFSAIIVPTSSSTNEWQLSLYSMSNPGKKQSLLEKMDIQEGGFLIVGQDTISIKTIKIQQVVDQTGKEHMMPFAIPFAYEMRIGDAVCAIIDTWGKILWIYKDLDETLKLAITSSTAAILLRRIHYRE